MRSNVTSMPRPVTRVSELLASVLITAVLVGVLSPIFRVHTASLGARDRKMQSTCAQNLRNIGMAMSAYLDDWDGVFPAWTPPGQRGFISVEDFKATYESRLYFGGTVDILSPSGARATISRQLADYVKDSSTWACPADYGMYATADDWGAARTILPFKSWRLIASGATQTIGVSYGYRGTNLVNQSSPLLTQRDPSHIALAAYPSSAVKNPNLRAMFWEMRAWHYTTRFVSLTARQTATEQVLFVDGHVRPVTVSEFKSSGAFWSDFTK